LISNDLDFENPARTEQTGIAWHALTAWEAAECLQTDPDSGLMPEEAKQRLKRYGPNRLQEEEKEPFWKEFIEELREPLILLLVFTGVVYILLGEISDGITIFFVILALNTIEVVNEQRAKKAITSLRKLAEPTALVVRGERLLELPVEDIVPGDLILLQAGRRVPADARLVESYGLAADESSLTGESVPVDKEANLTEGEDAPLAERANMVYSGTLITRGRGKAVVAGTGMATELGRIAGMAREVKEPRTPLQSAMDEVSKSLVWLALSFSIAIPILGVLIAKQPIQTMLLTGLSLAFATIPEEMPIIITMVLSLGAYRLSQQNAIVKRLNAVETLGAVTVIATDKTGTLTENRMEVSELYPATNQQEILAAATLCNDALVDGEQMQGDPLEIALVLATQKFGVDERGLSRDNPRVTEFSFENERKRMSVVARWNEPYRNSAYRVWVKGAPESILSISTRQHSDAGAVSIDAQAKQTLLEKAVGMAEQGYRVIAFAEKRMATIPTSQEEAESGLIFLGLAGLLDPPRAEVREAIKSMQGAGIRSLMITGDHPLTAGAIAQAVGLGGDHRVVSGTELDQLSVDELGNVVREVSLFARTTPEHKLRIVRALQAQGERVAVTGDGVNDAPALTVADIGVAMGETGSDVAREAADIVLADDNYTTIANAVREGRALFANLKKGVRYYLTIKVALVSVMLLPILLQIPVPFAPVQIILMELFMDLAAAAAFVAEPAEGDLMHMPPRNPKAAFMDRAMITSILVGAMGLFAAVSAVYLFTWYQGADQVEAQTVAFAAWMIGHVLLAFNMRSERQPILQLGLGSNRLMLAWGVAVAAFLALISLIPGAQNLMKITTLTASQWAMILAATLIGTFWIEAYKLFTYQRE
jgi:P-type Ca2+ transporter type 2C